MNIVLVGGVHGHLALMYAILGRFEKESCRPVDLILHLGEMGAFVADSRLDPAIRRRADEDAEELGFAEFIGADPPPTLLDPRPPLIFLPGNHEDFSFLDARQQSTAAGEASYRVSEDGLIRGLRSGRVGAFTGVGDTVRVGGVAGRGYRAYLGGLDRVVSPDEDALRLAELGPGALDVLVCREPPAGLWEEEEGAPAGDPTLRRLIESTRPRFVFFSPSSKIECWRVGTTEVWALGPCVYLPHGQWPVTEAGLALLRWEPEQPRVERLCPEWLRTTTRFNWRQWGRPAAGIVL